MVGRRTFSIEGTLIKTSRFKGSTEIFHTDNALVTVFTLFLQYMKLTARVHCDVQSVDSK